MLRPVSLFYLLCAVEIRQGITAAHTENYLPLLPSGPDGVCKSMLRRTRSMLNCTQKTGQGNGGEDGIRTHGTVSSTHAFQACPFSRTWVPLLTAQLVVSFYEKWHIRSR